MKFSELDEAVQDKVRSHQCLDVWWDFVYEDAVECAKYLGIKTDTNAIQFSGFWSQGDGASFVGGYSFKADAVKAIKDHAPQDEELHRIAEQLTALQTKVRLQTGGRLDAQISRSGRYSHSHTMQFDMSIVDTEGEAPAVLPPDEKDLADTLRSFADWIYKQLEAEYTYLTSDEALAEHDYDENGALL